MGKIRESMEKLVGQVRSSAAARHRGVANMRFATGDLLAQSQREGEDRRERLAQKARALSSGLAEEREGQLRSARALKTALGGASQSRRAGVREGRSAMRRRLEGLHRERRHSSAELKSAVRGEVAEIRSAVGELRGRVQTVMGAVAKDVAEAGRLWRTTGPARRK